MHGFDSFRFWQQHHEELLRDAKIERLARSIRLGRKRRSRTFPALAWETQRYGGRLFKLLRALSRAN